MTEAFDPSAPADPNSGLFGLNSSAEEAAVHIFGVPVDATTSFRRGAAQGPEAILAASHQVDLYDLVTGHPYRQGIHMPLIPAEIVELNNVASEMALKVIAAGGVSEEAELILAAGQVDRAQEAIYKWLRALVETALDQDKLVGIVGGDHSAPLAAIQAIAKRHPGMGILHFDAHADLRPAYEGFRFSHASIMHNVISLTPNVSKIMQVGVRDLCEEEHQAIQDSGGCIETIFDHHWGMMRGRGANLQELVKASVGRMPQEVYVSFDIDGLEPSLCPSTGTPVPGGLSWHDAMLWLEELTNSGRRIVGFDLCEVSPEPGRPLDQGWDQTVGARLLYRLIGFALKSRR